MSKNNKPQNESQQVGFGEEGNVYTKLSPTL